MVTVLKSPIYILAKRKQRNIKQPGNERRDSELVNTHSKTAIRGCLKLLTTLHKLCCARGQKHSCTLIGLVTKHKCWDSVKQLNQKE